MRQKPERHHGVPGQRGQVKALTRRPHVLNPISTATWKQKTFRPRAGCPTISHSGLVGTPVEETTPEKPFWTNVCEMGMILAWGHEALRAQARLGSSLSCLHREQCCTTVFEVCGFEPKNGKLEYKH